MSYPIALIDDMNAQLLDLARRQYGVLARNQLAEAGIQREAIKRLLRSGEWLPAFPDVYRFRGAPMTLNQRAVAALLWAGPESALSHATAGAFWNFESMPREQIHLITPRSCVPPKGIVVHRVKALPGDFVRRGDLVLTSVARTLIDLGSVVPVPALQRALDLALTRRLTTFDEVAERLALQNRPGTRGAAALRGLLKDGPRLPQSQLERRFLRHVKRSELPPMERQYEIDLIAFVAHVDFAIPSFKIAIECQGYEYHGGKRAWAKDGFRRNQLTLLGWRVLNVTWADLDESPEQVIKQIRSMIAALN